MINVSDLLARKSRAVHSIAPDVPVLEAVRLMAGHGIGAVLVREGGDLTGILSERDYARKCVLLGRESRDTAVRELMSWPVLYVGPAEVNENCMALMTGNKVRHLPVLDNGKLVGILSMRDLVKDIISEQKFVIEQLQHYITGGHG